MNISLKSLPKIGGRKITLMIVSLTLIMGVFPVLEHMLGASAETEDLYLTVPGLSIVQENSLYCNPNPSNPDPKVAGRMEVVVTAYSSTPWETDDTPFVTAAGTPVRDGIIANNLLPFGTKIRIPALYGDKIFVVEDRMNSKKGNYHFDIWFEDSQEAKKFGIKIALIEILE